MSAAIFLATATFLVGTLLLLGWAYATADNPRSGALFRTSLWLFALPIVIGPLSWMQFPLSVWVLVAFEEALKAFGAQREKNATNRFWLISLFGLWELTLSKPFWAWTMTNELAGWNSLQVIGLLYAVVLPVLMHCVTAAIYAYRFQKRLWAAFIASWTLHTAYNEAVVYFDLSVPATCLITVVLLALLIAALLPGLRPSQRGLRLAPSRVSPSD